MLSDELTNATETSVVATDLTHKAKVEPGRQVLMRHLYTFYQCCLNTIC